MGVYGQFDCDCNMYRQWGEDYLWSYLTACCDLVRWRNLWADWKQFLQLELVHSKLYSSACMRWSGMKYNSWVGTFTSDISAFSDTGDPAADCRDRNRVLAFPHLNSQTDMHIHPFIHYPSSLKWRQGFTLDMLHGHGDKHEHLWTFQSCQSARCACLQTVGGARIAGEKSRPHRGNINIQTEMLRAWD